MAEAIEDDLERRERQAGNRRRHHEALPLAGYRRPAGRYPGDGLGMIGDNMMVSDDNRPRGWLSGVVTLAVMVFAGGHFYRSAWKSLKNGTATMDTLVALVPASPGSIQ